MIVMLWLAAGFLSLPLGCASTSNDVELEGPSVLDTSISALKEENEFLRSELTSVWNTLAKAEQARTEDQAASQRAIAGLQAQVNRFKVVMKAQVDRFQGVMQAHNESIKKAKGTIRDLNRSVTKQGKILQKLGKRSTRADPAPVPAPSVKVTPPKTPQPPPKTSQPPPKTPQPVVSEEPILSALPTVDLNTASAAVLVRGLSLTRQEAKEIIKHRPYKRIGELVSMNVIPKATFDRIRKQLVISAPAK
jgi:DNA uptake protein ComE-like DNA-binding protein